MMPRFLLLAAFVAPLALSQPALADAATAEALFKAGKGLMDQKNYAEACPKFAASHKLDPAIGTLLNLADCHEKQGLLARAWVDWGEARDMAKREGDNKRADLAARRQATLDPRVPKITVKIVGKVEGYDVYRDETKLEPAMLGVALPVDPGPHKVTIRRGAEVLKESQVESKEKAEDEVTLDATGLPAPGPRQTAEQSGVIVAPKGDKPEMVRRNRGMFAGGIVMASVGGLTTLGGAVFVAAAPREGAAWGTLVVGAGLLGGGIALAVVGGKKVPKKPEKARTELFLGPASVMVKGQF
jgi:hypothetical protein